KSREIGVPLPKNLIGQATAADLILDLPILVGPIGLHEGISQDAGLAAFIERLEDRTIGEVELLRVVAAVEESAVDVGCPLLRERRAFGAEDLVPDRLRHLRRRLQGRQVEAS